MRPHILALLAATSLTACELPSDLFDDLERELGDPDGEWLVVQEITPTSDGVGPGYSPMDGRWLYTSLTAHSESCQGALDLLDLDAANDFYVTDAGTATFTMTLPELGVDATCAVDAQGGWDCGELLGTLTDDDMDATVYVAIEVTGLLVTPETMEGDVGAVASCQGPDCDQAAVALQSTFPCTADGQWSAAHEGPQ